MYDSPTGIEWNNGVNRDFGIAKYGDDAHLVVMFYKKGVHNAVKSLQHGAPIHDDVDFVKMHPPGERLNIIERPATEQDKRRFPRQWQQYMQGKTQNSDGIPIELLFPTHPHVGMNLRSAGVHTIEQCANMSTNAMETIGMGAQEYQNRAKQYLDVATGGKAFLDMKAEVEDLRRQRQRDQEQIQELLARLNLLSSQIAAGAYMVPGAMLPLPQGGQPRAPLPENTMGHLIEQQRRANQIIAGTDPNAAPTHDKMGDVPKQGFSNPWARKEHVEG